MTNSRVKWQKLQSRKFHRFRICFTDKTEQGTYCLKNLIRQKANHNHNAANPEQQIANVEVDVKEDCIIFHHCRFSGTPLLSLHIYKCPTKMLTSSSDLEILTRIPSLPIVYLHCNPSVTCEYQLVYCILFS